MSGMIECVGSRRPDRYRTATGYWVFSKYSSGRKTVDHSIYVLSLASFSFSVSPLAPENSSTWRAWRREHGRRVSGGQRRGRLGAYVRGIRGSPCSHFCKTGTSACIWCHSVHWRPGRAKQQQQQNRQVNIKGPKLTKSTWRGGWTWWNPISKGLTRDEPVLWISFILIHSVLQMGKKEVPHPDRKKTKPARSKRFLQLMLRETS